MRGETAPSPDLRGRGRRDRLAARRARRELPGAAAGQGRGEAGDPRHLHEGALGGVPGPGADRPGAAPARSPRRPLAGCASITIHTSHHTHTVIGTGANDPQKFDPRRLARDPRPLGHVHLRRRAGGRHLASPVLVRARTGGTARDRGALAEDPDGRGPGVDPSLPRGGSGREGLRRPGGHRAARTARSIEDELAVADAHPLGARPFRRPDYVREVPLPRRRRRRLARAGPLPRARRPPRLVPARELVACTVAAPGLETRTGGGCSDADLRTGRAGRRGGGLLAAG